MHYRSLIVPKILVIGLALVGRIPGEIDDELVSMDRDGALRVHRKINSVRVTIENHRRQELFLWQIDGDDAQMVLPLGASRRKSIVVESGFYYIANYADRRPPNGVIEMAVPAWFDGLDCPAESPVPELHITIKKPPLGDDHWRWIPDGPALVGDVLGIGQEDERPARIESIRGFWLAQSEVTNEEYAEFLNHLSRVDDQWIDLPSQKCRIKQRDDRFVTDAPTLPVVTVTRAGADAYCCWLSEQTGLNCRLPREAEWEKAARGKGSTVFSYGNVYRRDAANQESGQLLPVGSFEPNGYGLYDMTGNVFEWVADEYRRSDPHMDLQGMTHVLRGGSFVLDGTYLRNSFRMRQSPTVMADDIGFRVARDATEEESEK